MTTATSRPHSPTDKGRTDSLDAPLGAAARAELRAWGLLATGSLAIAGIFAVLVAASRVPGSQKLIPWPVEFFGKGLVVHVTFSFVVWFLAVFALLASLATHRLAAEGYGALRLQWLGRLGLLLVGLSFPLLLVPAFIDGSVASLNNYVPVIAHPVSEVGLVVLYVGVLGPVVRLLANEPWSAGTRDPLVLAVAAGSVIYVAAMAAILTALVQTAGKAGHGKVYEEIFWGGGHILQFLNALLMLTAWVVLAHKALGRGVLRGNVLIAAALLLVLPALSGLALYAWHGSFTAELRMGFTKLQYALAPPTLLVAAALLSGIAGAWRHNGRLPWGEPAFLALVLSPVVFGVGGILGLFVDGADTRTPAHYHGVIAGVNLAFMGLFLAWLLPLAGREATTRLSRLRAEIVLFGLGQLVACIGLFVAGGYGAPRKVAGAAQGLADVARLGMYLNGIGALIAVVGGVMFIWTVMAALLRRA